MSIQNFRTVFTGAIATQTAPTDASSVPSTDQATAASGGVFGQQFMLEFDLRGSGGASTATIDLYFWDGVFRRWAKAATPISLTSALTASGPASRFTYALDSIQPYQAVLPVVSAISGTGATIDCRVATNGPN